jgi:hypothetical protein
MHVISMAASSSSDSRLPATDLDPQRAPVHGGSRPPAGVVGRPRRRPTKEQYRRRRVLALGVAVVLLVVIAVLARAMFGGSSPSDAAANDTALDAGGGSPNAAVAPAASVVTSDTAVVTVAGTDAPESVPAANVGVPSADNPVHLYIAGDSDAGTFGPYLQTLMKKTGMVDVTLDYKVSSGLARPDFYDWPARFAQQLPKVNPGIVVLTFGGNDAQGLSDKSGTFVVNQPKGGDDPDAEWRAEYGRRVGAVMDELTQGGRTLIWVGIPNDDNPDVTARLAVQDAVVREQVAAHPGVVFVDTWQMFSGRNGGWADWVIDPRDGQGKPVRAKDGFHLNTEGAEILALKIADTIKADLTARGATL